MLIIAVYYLCRYKRTYRWISGGVFMTDTIFIFKPWETIVPVERKAGSQKARRSKESKYQENGEGISIAANFLILLQQQQQQLPTGPLLFPPQKIDQTIFSLARIKFRIWHGLTRRMGPADLSRGTMEVLRRIELFRTSHRAFVNLSQCSTPLPSSSFFFFLHFTTWFEALFSSDPAFQQQAKSEAGYQKIQE